MLVRSMLILFTMISIAGCRDKRTVSVDLTLSTTHTYPANDVSSDSEEAALICNDARAKVALLVGADEEENIKLDERVELMLLNTSCFPAHDVDVAVATLAQTEIEVMCELHPNQAFQLRRDTWLKELFARRMGDPVARTAHELIDLYQAVDAEKPQTIADADKRLQKIESYPATSEMIRLTKEALMREALVCQYRNPTTDTSVLDSVIGAYPFDRVKDRYAFAKSVVDCFQQHDERAIPVSFLPETRLDPKDRAKMLIYILTPMESDADDEIASNLDRRLETYVSAGYDVTEVNAAAVEMFVEQNLFAEALAFANKNFDEAHTARLEDRFMKLLRERGCYSVIEDPDGHKMRMYNFKQACSSEPEESVEE